MNIQEAKEEIIRTVQAYLEKDEEGQYLFPAAHQRPLLLMGPPGIGKTAILEQAAKDCGVSAQREILLCGGTDTSVLQKARAGVQAGAVSIPTRYIHSPSELCAVSDVEDAAKLLAQYALQK